MSNVPYVQRTGQPRNAVSMSRSRREGAVQRKQVGNYIVGKAIGEGTFGKVKLGIHIPTGEKVAVKILEKSKIKDQADIRRVNREIKILKKARHGNVVHLYEVLDTANTIYLMMEMCEGGEMFDYIVKHKYVKEPQACAFFHQIVDGLEALHKYEITHRDLKPENLLLKASAQGWLVKIVDFGLSNTHDGGRLLSTACGSPCYAAPEMIAGKRYDGPKADTWSMGCILFALVCGYLPFEDPNTMQLYKKIMAGDYKPAKWLSAEVKDLIRKILEVDPAKRYTIADIRKHRWYLQVDEINVPSEDLTTEARQAEHEEVLALLTQDAKYETEAVEHELARQVCNGTTAMYFLLRQKLRKQRLAEHREAVAAATKHRAGQPPPKAKARNLPSFVGGTRPTAEGAALNSAAVTRGMADLSVTKQGAVPQKENKPTAAAVNAAVPAPIAVKANAELAQSPRHRKEQDEFMAKVAAQKKHQVGLRDVKPNVPQLQLGKLEQQQQEQQSSNVKAGLPKIAGVMTSQTARGDHKTATAGSAAAAAAAPPSRQVQSARAAVVPTAEAPPTGFGAIFMGAPEGFGVPTGDANLDADGRPSTRRSRSRGGQRGRAADGDNTGLEISGTGLAPEASQSAGGESAHIPIHAMDAASELRAALTQLPPERHHENPEFHHVAKAPHAPSVPVPSRPGAPSVSPRGGEAAAGSAAAPPQGGNSGGGRGRAGRNIVRSSPGKGTALGGSSGGVGVDVSSPRHMAAQNKANAQGGVNIF